MAIRDRGQDPWPLGSLRAQAQNSLTDYCTYMPLYVGPSYDARGQWSKVCRYHQNLKTVDKTLPFSNRMGRGLHGVAEASYFQVPLLIGWVNKLKQKKNII